MFVWLSVLHVWLSVLIIVQVCRSKYYYRHCQVVHKHVGSRTSVSINLMHVSKLNLQFRVERDLKVDS